MTPRPAGGGGRPQQPVRRSTQQRGAKAAQPRTQKATPPRKAGQPPKLAADQQRMRLLEQQRRAAAARRSQQQRQRQAQFLREAQLTRQQAEAERQTTAVREEAARLETILSTGLRRSARIDLDSLRRTPEETPFDPGPLGVPVPEPVWKDFAPAAGFLSGLWGGQQRRERQEADAREAYERARQDWERAERERAEQLAAAERAHEATLAELREEVERYHSRIARVAAGLRDRDPKVVESFLRTVLRRVPLPPGFPREVAVWHDSHAEWAVLRVRLPGRDVVPEVTGYEYLAAADELQPLPRPADESAELYRRVLAQVALLVVRDVFDAEPRLAGVSFHGHVEVPGDAGKRDRRRLIGLSVYRDTFEELDLAEVSPAEGLAKLDATVSSDPYAYEPIPAT